jgi:hypothetical protein
MGCSSHVQRGVARLSPTMTPRNSTASTISLLSAGATNSWWSFFFLCRTRHTERGTESVGAAGVPIWVTDQRILLSLLFTYLN